MRVLILGVGDAFTKAHFSTSALIEAPGGHVLLDCPDLIHRVIHEGTAQAGWSVDSLEIHDVLLTHLHGDHCNGLESLVFAHRYLPRPAGAPTPTARLRVHTSRPVADRLWDRLAPAMDGADRGTPRTAEDFFHLRILEPETEASVAGLTIRCRFTTHPIPTIGLLISDGQWTLGWSGDTGFERAHIDWLGQSDLIVHESNLGASHTPIESLNALPGDLRARMSLIHLPDDFDPSTTDMRMLREGDVLEGP